MTVICGLLGQNQISKANILRPNGHLGARSRNFEEILWDHIPDHVWYICLGTEVPCLLNIHTGHHETRYGVYDRTYTLHWRHNGHDCVSNHQPYACLRNRLFRCRSKNTSKLRVTGLSLGGSPGTGEFFAQMASNAENVSIWWRHHEPNQNHRRVSCGMKQ